MNSLSLAIGLGCKSGISANAVVHLIETAIAQVDGVPAGLFTAEDKRPEAAFIAAAAGLGLPLIYLPRDAMQAAAGRAVTKSARVLALFGVPSIAETAALAGAGPGSTLVLPRISADGVSCAVAALRETP